MEGVGEAAGSTRATASSPFATATAAARQQLQFPLEDGRTAKRERISGENGDQSQIQDSRVNAKRQQSRGLRLVEGEKEEEAHSGIAGNSLRKVCVSKLDKSGVPYFDLCWIKYRKLCNES